MQHKHSTTYAATMSRRITYGSWINASLLTICLHSNTDIPVCLHFAVERARSSLMSLTLIHALFQTEQTDCVFC